MAQLLYFILHFMIFDILVIKIYFLTSLLLSNKCLSLYLFIQVFLFHLIFVTTHKNT